MQRPVEHSATRRALTCLCALLLAASAVTAGTAGAVPDATAWTAQSDDAALGNETADHVYRYANGSAVLAYETDPADEDASTVQFGADVSSALVDALVVSEYDNPNGATGQFGLLVTPDAVSGDGNASFDAPPGLEHLDATVEGTVTPNESSAAATLDLTAGQQFAAVAGANTTGEVVVGPDSFEADASYSVESPALASSRPTAQSYAISETEDGYELDVDVNRTVNRFATDRWNTSQAARQSILATYEAVATQLGGSAEVTVHAHEFTAGEGDRPGRLDMEYTVSMRGIEEGLADQVVSQLAATESVDLSDAERTALRDSITDLTVDTLAFSMRANESGSSGAASVDVSGYEDPLVRYLEAAADGTPAVNESQVETLRQQLDARDAANLRQVVGWTANLSSGFDSTRLQAQVTYDAVNWGAYTDELAARGMPYETDVTFNGTARTVDDAVEADLSFRVSRDRIVDAAISQAVSGAEQSPGTDDSALRTLRALEDADLQVARADLVFGRDRVEVRAAAQFENLSEFQGALDQFPGDVPVTHLYGEQSEGATTTYVYVENLDMTDAELRESPLADGETTIHAPGEWDRTFPTMDVPAASEYLGVDVRVSYPPHSGVGTATATATPSPTTAGPTPTTTGPATTSGATSTTAGDGVGLGIGVALVALLAAALVAVRRRD